MIPPLPMKKVDFFFGGVPYIYILNISTHNLCIHISLIIHLTVTGFDVYYNVPALVHVRHMSRLVRMHLTLQVYVTIQRTSQFSTHYYRYKYLLQCNMSLKSDTVLTLWFYMSNIKFLQQAAHIPKSKIYNDIIPIHHTHHNVKIIMFLHASMKSSHVSLHMCNYLKIKSVVL